MTTRIPENFPAWFVGWNLVTTTGDTMPPRDPKPNGDDDDEDDEEEDERKDDREPAVIREPDEDE